MSEVNMKWNVSSNPHVRSKVTTSNIMFFVVLSLLPATGFGIYNFGIRALWHVLLTVASCVLAEAAFAKLAVLVGDTNDKGFRADHIFSCLHSFGCFDTEN